MGRVPLDIASKIVISDAFSTRDVRNLTHTNQFLRYANLPTAWASLELHFEAEDRERLIGQGDPGRMAECFMLELSHLHVFVKRLRVWLPNKEVVQTDLIRCLPILAELLPLLPSLRELTWMERSVGTFNVEARVAVTSVLIALLRSHVTKISVHGSLLSFLPETLIRDTILQSRVEEVRGDSFDDDAVNQMAALSHAPSLTSLDISFNPLSRRDGIEPAKASLVVADESWGRLRRLDFRRNPEPVLTFLLCSAQSFKIKRSSDGGGGVLGLHELFLCETLRPPLLIDSITSLATPNRPPF